MKKILVLFLTVCMLFSLTSCGNKPEVDSPDTSGIGTEEVEENAKREPVQPAPADVIVGEYTLSAEYLSFDEPIINDESGNPDMDVLGDTVYVSDGGSQVMLYTLEGSALTYVKTVSVEDTGDSISVDGTGKIYADGGVFEATVYDPESNASGTAVASGELTASKNSNFALTYFPGRETVTMIKDNVASDWLIDGEAGLGKFQGISIIEIVGDTVVIGGEDAENYIMGAFDMDGNQQMLSNDSLAGTLPSAVIKTDNGYISSSVNEMTFVNAEGNIIGEADAKQLFGIDDNTLWIYEMAPLSDGSFLVLAQLSNSDVDGNEIVLFKVSGF